MLCRLNEREKAIVTHALYLLECKAETGGFDHDTSGGIHRPPTPDEVRALISKIILAGDASEIRELTTGPVPR